MNVLAIAIFKNTRPELGSNQGLFDLRSNALQTELSEHVGVTYISLREMI